MLTSPNIYPDLGVFSSWKLALSRDSWVRHYVLTTQTPVPRNSVIKVGRGMGNQLTMNAIANVRFLNSTRTVPSALLFTLFDGEALLPFGLDDNVCSILYGKDKNINIRHQQTTMSSKMIRTRMQPNLRAALSLEFRVGEKGYDFPIASPISSPVARARKSILTGMLRTSFHSNKQHGWPYWKHRELIEQ